MQILLVEFFNTPDSLSGVLKVFFFRYKDVVHPKRLSDAHFQLLVFLKEINNFLVTDLVALIIWFKYWFRTAI